MTTISTDPLWIKDVKTRLIYDTDTGSVHWKSLVDPSVKGQKIHVWINKDGYALSCTSFGGRRRLIHRLVWVLFYGEDAKQELDHIDGNKTNNSHTNLRDVDKSTNMHNSKAKGYYWHKTAGKWYAQIRINYKTKNLGLFNTEEEARAAYVAAKKLHGFIHRNS